MNIQFIPKQEHMPCMFNIVERKGVGHPDTLADLIADQFAFNYTKYGLQSYEGLLNHNVDKVVLRGGVANISFGNASVIKPIECVLYGKVTSSIGDFACDINSLFNSTVAYIFDKIFGDNTFSKNSIIAFINTNSGVGAEHGDRYYEPKFKQDLTQVGDKLTLTDTAVCAAFSCFTEAEDLCIEIEKYVNNSGFKQANPDTGYDVKVLVVESENLYEITVCIPFIASLTPSYSHYTDRLNEVRAQLIDFIKSQSSKEFQLVLNSKDREGYGYLTVFGTALDKGDFGMVGRGNKQEGIISVLRPNIVEAPSGKNVFRSTGKLGHMAATLISQQIHKEFGIDNEVFVVSKNGKLLAESSVFILSSSLSMKVKPNIEEIVIDILSSHWKIVEYILSSNPLVDKFGYCLRAEEK